MKARPRRTEREVAALLSEIFSCAGMSSVKRIPILGRTGPDIEINEVGLVVDVKSRRAVPKSALPKQRRAIQFSTGLIAFRLNEMADVANLTYDPVISTPISVSRWYDHMDEWRLEHRGDGITALVLHRPQMPIGNAAVVIKLSDRSLLCQRLHVV